MTRVCDETLIETLVADVRPVTPLAPPFRRAAVTLMAVAVAGTIAILAASNLRQFRSLHAGREITFALEMSAMLATGALAITGAFFASVPGRSRRWLTAPLPFFAAWLLLSGAGCYSLSVPGGLLEHAGGESWHCFLFILGISAMVAPLVIWRLARAAPIDPLPVSLLGGLGVAALSAFLLQFFHPFAVTLFDLCVHLLAMVLVVAIAGVLNRRALRAAVALPRNL